MIMKYADLNDFIEENGLLKNNIESSYGIYAITVDDYIVAIRESATNVKQSCKQIIYEIENAMLTTRYEFQLLLAAKLGGHEVDCVGLGYLPRKEALPLRMALQRKYEPFIDVIVFKERNPYAFKIEDLIHSLKYKIEDIEEIE